jgi:uncharacterized protein YqjF (DUF2071 family)
LLKLPPSPFSLASASTLTKPNLPGRRNYTMSTVEKYVAKDGDAVLPLFSLKGKTAIVTGSGAGIGYAVADAFAEAGANVAFFYNSNPKAVDRAAETAAKYGVQCKSPH